MGGNTSDFRMLVGLAESVDEVIWVTDAANTALLYVNPAFERVWGSTRESAYAEPHRWLESLPPPSADVHTVRVDRPDGAARWVRIKSIEITDPSDRVVRRAGIATDVTEQHDLEVQLQHSQRMESLGRLAGGVAHDFNNILCVIASNNSFLSSMVAPQGEANEVVSEIDTAVKRAVGLTRQLLAFTRKQTAKPLALDANAVIVETRKMLRRMIGEDIELETSLEPDLPSVWMDPGHLVQVLMNLAVNARDAMPGGGKLRIATRSEPETRRIELVITDNGSGMSPEVRARVFEPFFTTKVEGKGTGMGLAVVHGIVRDAEGDIEIESAPGQGTTFRIRLPISVARGSRTTIAPPPDARGSETVLIVDDDVHIRRAMVRALRGAGFLAFEAATGEEALAAMKTQRIDLLLTDVVMPGMNGHELAEAAIAVAPNLRVIYMSGYTDDEVDARGVPRGQVDMLEKPPTRQALVSKIRAVLDRGTAQASRSCVCGS